MKVPVALFKEALQKNGGIYARAAQWLWDRHGIKISRAAIGKRAKRYPQLIEEIESVNIDWGESALQDLIRNSQDDRIKLQAVKFYLTTKGKTRGYSGEITVKGEINLNQITGVNIIPDDGNKPETSGETTSGS